MSSLKFDLASAEDDAGLRRLLRENPMQGSISVSFEREPNYFNASAIEGPIHQTLVARELNTNEIIGVGNRSVRPMFVNGEVREIGYMSQLRIHPKYGQGLYLARGLAQGFKLYRDLHADGRAPFYLMSIIEDNLPARRLLTSGLPDYPCAKEYARMFTYAIYPTPRKHVGRIANPVHSLQLIHGNDQYIDQIVDCLNRNGARKQFASYWTCDSLFASNLNPSDFFLALDGNCIVGCLACWDQTAFKQTVVRGYSGALAHWRKLLNVFSSLGGWPYLPEPNTPLRYSYGSHLAVDDDNPVVFAALLRALYNHNLELGYRYFVIGLAESNPLREVVKAYHPLTYISQLYLVAWEDGMRSVQQVDARIPAPEIALL
ncbi:MAG: hypothetical protein HY258_02490 [Chloroflexi bacterium]|nr:hypothetical protein [Chloroflexota bacterium]